MDFSRRWGGFYGGGDFGVRGAYTLHMFRRIGSAVVGIEREPLPGIWRECANMRIPAGGEISIAGMCVVTRVITLYIYPFMD